MKNSIFTKFADKEISRDKAKNVRGGGTWTCYRGGTSLGEERGTVIPSVTTAEEAMAFIENTDYAMCQEG